MRSGDPDIVAQYQTRCPAHDDGKASLSVAATRDGRVLLHCHAGCAAEAVVAALGLTMADLAAEGRDGTWMPRGSAVAVYDYVDEAGTLLFQVCRTADKQFPCRRPDPASKTGWAWNLRGVRRVPYRLPRVIEAVRSGETIYVPEGEKDVHAIEAAGGVATCNPGGAGKWRKEYADFFRGARRVVIIADKDKPGRDHAKEEADSLRGVVGEVVVVQARAGKDAADHLAAGHGLDDFVPVDDQTAAKPAEEVTSELEMWPDPPAEAAFHGLAGDFVRLVAPHSEADPVALLIQFLVAFGSVVGRGPHFLAEADEHMLNLFAALVGASSKGRKGTSWGQVARLMARIDEAWTKQSIGNGLVSGEGLIWAVRDQVTKRKKSKKGNAYEEVVEDPGIADKRLLVIEAEFARILRVLGREGNTLSAVIRSAWDTGDLRSMSKKDPGRASGAHVSIVAHITRNELTRYLDTTEAGNGFGNRFLWFCVRRSKVLPEGGRVPEEELLGLGVAAADAVSFARTVKRVEFDAGARELWHERYERLSEGKPGLLGAMLGRAEAQVLRLACLYALLDRSPRVQRVHLEAALALWDYSERSARYIFGASLGDPVADKVLGALRDAPDGLTRTRIRELFAGHASKQDIDRGLSLLAELGLANCRPVPTDGRPAETWFAAGAPARKAQEAQKGGGQEEAEGASRASRASRAGASENDPEGSDDEGPGGDEPGDDTCRTPI
jgi:hypothetical protein